MRRALTSDDHQGLRILGGVLFGAGALVLLIRRTSFADPWGDAAIFLTLWIPAVFLFGTGLAGARANAQPTAWQAVFTVFGLLLIPLSLFAFLNWIGGDTESSWNATWILGLSAALGLLAGVGAGVRYCTLIGSLLLAGAWLSVWDAILSGGLGDHLGATRWLLVAIGLILLLTAGVVASRRSEESSDFVTAAGVALVTAGAISVIAATTAGTLIVFTELKSSLFWDLELLVVSLGILAHGAVTGLRGPVYVGAAGLLAFIGQVGLDLDDKSPSGAVVGWPLVLLAIGALALAISVAPAFRRARS